MLLPQLGGESFCGWQVEVDESTIYVITWKKAKEGNRVDGERKTWNSKTRHWETAQRLGRDTILKVATSHDLAFPDGLRLSRVIR